MRTPRPHLFCLLFLLGLAACGGSGASISEQGQKESGSASGDFNGTHCIYGFGGPIPIDMAVSLEGDAYQVSIPVYITQNSPAFSLSGVFSGTAPGGEDALRASGQVLADDAEAIPMKVEFSIAEDGVSLDGSWSLPEEGLSGKLTGDFAAACASSPSFDTSREALPHFASSNYIELGDIDKVSVFRSGIGHDYSDGFETCRSMKHYFQPYFQGLTIPLYSPAAGRIVSIQQEQTYGLQVWIQSSDYPSIFFGIFHVDSDSIWIGQKLAAGEPLGTHFGDQTSSDIAVRLKDPQAWRLVSFFDVISDEVFGEFMDRGVSSREEMILAASMRDAWPLTCNGESFVSADPLPHVLITLIQ